MLVDLRGKGLTGRDAENMLDAVKITCNMNVIPFDPQPPRVTSGIRLGTAAMTTRGMDEAAMHRIAEIIHYALDYSNDEQYLIKARSMVDELVDAYPLQY
ncbi:MAG: serine hydroxymethyltransferase, partial [Eubacteriales bacterium]|nr:serine hydroxymethyltransferase [Eubacteriales bacterium]